MPHFTIEYSANLEQRADMAEIIEVVRKAAIETGIFPLGGIRVRAIRCDYSTMVDGNPEHAFLAMLLRLGEGRDLATRKAAGELIFKALCDHLAPVLASSTLAISFDMQVNDAATSFKRNNLHDYLAAKKTAG